MSRFRLFFIACLVASSTATCFAADDASRLFDELYGKRYSTTQSSISRVDDVELAKELLGVARNSTNQASLVHVFCSKSYDLGMRHPAGYSTAVDAMKVLASHSDQHAAEANKKMIDALGRMYRVARGAEKIEAGNQLLAIHMSAADAAMETGQFDAAPDQYRSALAIASRTKSEQLDRIRQQLEAASHQKRLRSQIDRYEEMLLKDASDNATAEKLVKLYLLEMNDLDNASRHVRLVKDEQLKKLIEASRRSPDGIAPSQGMWAGEIYQQLARETQGVPRIRALEEATYHFNRFINAKEGTSLEQTKAKLKVGSVSDEIAVLRKKYNVSTGTPTRTQPSNGSVKELIVEVSVDGESRLHITPTAMHWSHHAWGKPWNCHVNGKSLPMKWSNPDTRAKDSTKPTPVKIRGGELKVEKLSGASNRGSITAQLTKDKFIITVNDHQNGAARYKFRVYVK